MVFSLMTFIDIPNSEYGSNNQLHMKTLSNDFDHDGDADLAIHWTKRSIL